MRYWDLATIKMCPQLPSLWPFLHSALPSQSADFIWDKKYMRFNCTIQLKGKHPKGPAFGPNQNSVKAVKFHKHHSLTHSLLKRDPDP